MISAAGCTGCARAPVLAEGARGQPRVLPSMPPRARTGAAETRPCMTVMHCCPRHSVRMCRHAGSGGPQGRGKGGQGSAALRAGLAVDSAAISARRAVLYKRVGPPASGTAGGKAAALGTVQAPPGLRRCTRARTKRRGAWPLKMQVIYPRKDCETGCNKGACVDDCAIGFGRGRPRHACSTSPTAAAPPT